MASIFCFAISSDFLNNTSMLIPTASTLAIFSNVIDKLKKDYSAIYSVSFALSSLTGKEKLLKKRLKQ